MLATRELLRREHLGKIAGKTFVIQASPGVNMPHGSVECMQRLPDLSSYSNQSMRNSTPASCRAGACVPSAQRTSGLCWAHTL